MKKRANPHYKRSSRVYSEEQLAGLHTSTTVRKQETIVRLRTAIASLKNKNRDITAHNIHAECGLHYSSYVRNDEAIALFRANSTHLLQQRKSTKRRLERHEDASSGLLSRDPLLNYKKPQLVHRLRETQQQVKELQMQLATLADAYLQRDAQVVELETKLIALVHLGKSIFVINSRHPDLDRST